MRSVDLVDVDIHGEIQNLKINGVDIGSLVDAELDRRYPLRSKMRPTDPAGFREGWDILKQPWGETVERARRLQPELLHESVDGEWSFLETLRHLVFATDSWIRRAILGDPSPWDPLDLPWDEMPDTPGVPLRPRGTTHARHRARAAPGPNGHRAPGHRRSQRRVAGRQHRTGREARLATAPQLPGARVPAHHPQRRVGAPTVCRAGPGCPGGAGCVVGAPNALGRALSCRTTSRGRDFPAEARAASASWHQQLRVSIGNGCEPHALRVSARSATVPHPEGQAVGS